MKTPKNYSSGRFYVRQAEQSASLLYCFSMNFDPETKVYGPTWALAGEMRQSPWRFRNIKEGNDFMRDSFWTCGPTRARGGCPQGTTPVICPWLRLQVRPRPTASRDPSSTLRLAVHGQAEIPASSGAVDPIIGRPLHAGAPIPFS